MPSFQSSVAQVRTNPSPQPLMAKFPAPRATAMTLANTREQTSGAQMRSR